ncbi:MAG: CHAT domain-containing protein [Roseivirga sp.]|nr:CHAT domain-containing protein [Roseivirga sp.]
MNKSLSLLLRSILYVVLLSKIQVLLGQNTDLLKNQVEQAEGFYINEQFDSARFYADLALANFNQTGKTSDLYLRLRKVDIETDYSRADYDLAAGKIDEFRAFLNTNFPDEQDGLANLFTVEALMATRLGKYREGNDLLLKSNYLREKVRLRADLTTAEKKAATTDLANNYLWLANLKLEVDEPDSVVIYYNKAIELYTLPGISHPKNLGQSYRGLSLFYYLRRDAGKSMDYALKALKIFDINNKLQKNVIANTYLIVANLHQTTGNSDSALFYMNGSLEIQREISSSNDLGIAISLQNIGSVYNTRGDLSKAERLFEEALDIALKSDKRDDIFLMYLYNSLSILSLKKYQAPQVGLDYQNEALKLIANNERSPRVISIEIDILQDAATAYLSRAVFNLRSGSMEPALADYELAVKNLEKSLRLELELTNGKFYRTTKLYGMIGNAHRLFEQYELAEKWYLKGLEFSIGFTDAPLIKPLLTTLNMGLSDTYHNQGDKQKFEKHWKLALDLIDDNSGHILGSLSEHYTQLGSNYRDLGDFEQARFFINKSIDANLIVSRDSVDQENIREQAFSFFTHTESLFELALISEAEYATDNDINTLKKAHSQYREYVEYILAIVSSTRNQKDIIDQTGFYNNGFQGLARTSYQLFQQLGTQAYIEEAFRASQLSRSILLKNSASRKGNTAFANVPDSLLQEDYSAEADIDYYSSRLQSARLNRANDSTIQSIQSLVFKAKIRKQNIRAVLSKAYPGYYALRYDINLATSQELQNNLSDDETFIEYLIGQDEILTFVITKNNFEALLIPKKSNFDSLTRGFSSTLQQLDTVATDQLLKKLHTELILPLKPHIQGNRITIVPDGSIWNVNFDLLKSESGRYLLQDFAISYSYSAPALLDTQHRITNRKELLAFSFGDKDNMRVSNKTVRNDSRVELPGSAKEIFDLSEFLPGDYHYRNTAHESTFKKLAPSYNVLHLAIHGEIDEINYDASRLYFNTDGRDTLNDGLLYPFELYNMELNANLAVLSACNSGGGRIARGEGIMSLGRAFQYAGVNSLLLSKWEVSDAVAPDIITSFYKNLDLGMSKDEALRRAKLTFLEGADNITKSPYYWGSFFVLGDSKPIALRSGISYTQIGIIFFLFIFSAMIAFRIRMKKKISAS